MPPAHRTLLLRAGDSGNDQPNDNGPNPKLKGIYVQDIMNLQRQHVTLKFKHTHMNDVLVETWRYFQLSGVPVIINAFKKKKLVPLNPPGEDTNTQAYIEAAHPSKGNKKRKSK